jgi:hypothetical protein
MAVIRSIALTLSNSKHSKAYAASIESVEGDEPDGLSYVVTSTYGAIGSIQKPGKGTRKPVTLEAAEKFYNRLVTEKTTVPCSCCAGLYVGTGAAAAAAKPVVSAALAHFPSFFPELLVPITETESSRYLQDDQYSLEEKFDGSRLSTRLDNDTCAAYNDFSNFVYRRRIGQALSSPLLRRITGEYATITSMRPRHFWESCGRRNCESDPDWRVERESH